MTDRNRNAVDSSISSISRRRLLQGTASAGVLSLLSATSVSADGTAELVVRAEDVEVPILAESASVVDELKAEAEESQAPIVNYVEKTDGLSVKNRFWLANALLLEVDTNEVDPDRLAAQKGVAEVHPNYHLEIPEPKVSSAVAEDGDVTYGLDQIDVPEAWDRFDARGQGAKIAVLDTGVDPDHPDIDISPENFSEFDGDGNEIDSEPHDSAYHGTHVSGTATGGDDSGTAIGVAPEAELLHSLILPEGGGSFVQIIAGMEWAVEQDADVISMSLGATGFYGQMIEPVRNAHEAGTIVVAAAGNDGEGTTGTPGNTYDSFSVGASNEDEGIASFSSGETVDTASDWGSSAPDDWPDSYIVPDASAPGVDVLSSYPVNHADGPYNRISGTSMATPHMSGLVGLMASAGAEALDPEQVSKALTNTAWKPDGESEEKDNRYGHGIVDAVAAVGRVAADSGVTGTITDADGNPVEGATVELDGFPTETDENGEYRLRAASGTYELSVDAFGHAGESVTVEVTDDFLTQDFTLADDLAVTTVAEQPEGLEAGEAFDVEVQVANAEALTAERVGTYDGETDLSVNDEDAAFGERFSFDGVTSGVVTLTVDTGEDGSGDLELELALEGLGETLSVTTGSTSVYADSVSVGLVDAVGAYGGDVQALLDDEMHPRYNFTALDAETALASAKDREHDAYVVQNLGSDADVVSEFADVATAPEIGVVYLDQFGTASDAIYQLSDVTGDPSEATEGYVQMAVPPVNYTVDRDHPALEGIAESGDSVTVNEPDAVSGLFYYFGGFHSFFEDYRGPVSGTALAGTALGNLDTGQGLAVDDLSRIVLASSLGIGTYVGRDAFTSDGKALLGNLVEHVAQTPPVEVVQTPAERVAPGESSTFEVEGSNLVEAEIGVSGLEFIDEGDLTLYVNGQQVPFGEPIAFDEPYDGTVEATIETTAGQIGEFAFDARFVSINDNNHEVETAATLRPTTVYESPIQVPTQLDDLQAAVDFVNSGDEVLVAGGTYEVDDDRGTQSGLYVGNSGITIRGAEGETVEIVHARDLPAPNVVNVDADDVTLENLSANVIDGASDPKNEIGSGVRVNELVSGTTIRNVTASGTSGVFFDQGVSDVHVEDVTAVETAIGVGTDIYGGGPVSNATITGVTVESPDEFGWGGVYVENGDRITVTDCDVTYPAGYDAGILIWGDFSASDDNRVADNTIVGPAVDEPSYGDGDCGIYVDDAHAEIENNEITDAYLGIRVGDFGFGERDVYVENNTVENANTGYYQTGDYVSLERNVFEADTGFNLDGGYFGLEADAVVARNNDLSATDLPFVGEPSDGYGDPEGPFDARMNYLGDRSYDETIADGDVAYDPFLTEPPADAGSSAAATSDASATTTLATDLYLDPDGSYALGIPGPTDKTIYEMLGADGYDDFAGDLAFWNESSEKWQRVTGEGDLKYVDTLSAFKVTPSEGVRAVVDFQTREGTPPGHHESDPGTTSLQQGWNFVAAPQYGDESDVFGAEGIEEVVDDLHAPGSQMGDGEKQAFSGYKVKASEDVELAAGLDAHDPTMTELYESLGLDPVIHDGVGPATEPTESTATVADVLDAASDDEAEDAVAALVGHRIGQRLEADDDLEAAVDGIEAVANETAEATPASDRDLVEAAVGRVVEHAFRSTVGATNVEEDDADFDADVTQADAENSGDATSSLGLLGSVLSD